jgi:SAM-dependent methyltransferase
VTQPYTEHPDDPLLALAEARNYNAWIFGRARPYLGRRVLDVGAGLGVFSELAARAGSEVVAVEPDPRFVALARERLAGTRVEVVEETAEQLPPGEPFDSVICFNVLEHVPEDGAALAAFRERLRPGGRLLLLVPAHERLYGAYDRAVGHERRYERAGLRALLGTAGYDVGELRYVNPVGALGWLARVRFARSSEWPAGSFRTFDRLVPALRHLDALRLPFGLSLWAVAVRPA